MRRTESLISLTVALALLVAACETNTGGDPKPVTPCPELGHAMRIGTAGARANGVDPSVVGISGLGVSASDADGSPIAWAVGDRSANEIAGPDEVFLFALDPRDGQLLERYALDPSALQPGPDGDPVSSLEQTPAALPDFEELSIEPGEAGSPARIWLFDTGDNEGTRTNLNAYVVSDPRAPGRDTAEIEPERYPIELVGPAGLPTANIEGAMVDPARGDSPTTVYLIPKFPVDADDDGVKDDVRVFSFEPDPGGGGDEPNQATVAGSITLADPALRVTAAAASQDGTAFAVRAVSGGEEGQPNLDEVALWTRDPSTPIDDVLAERPVPDCMYSFDTAEGASSEETLAFDLADGPAWSGFLWTHDEPDPGVPLFASERTPAG